LGVFSVLLYDDAFGEKSERGDMTTVPDEDGVLVLSSTDVQSMGLLFYFF